MSVNDYDDFEVQNFTIKTVRSFIGAVRERAIEEVERRDEFAREAEQQVIRQAQEYMSQVEEQQSAIRNFDICTQEVEEWRQRQEQAGMQDQLLAERLQREQNEVDEQREDRLWGDMESSQQRPPVVLRGQRTPRPRGQRPPQTNRRGRGRGRGPET